MVDAEHAAGHGAPCGISPPVSGGSSGARVTERPVCLEAFQVRGADASGYAIQFRIMPGDRERNRRVQQDAEVVGVVRVLPK